MFITNRCIRCVFVLLILLVFISAGAVHVSPVSASTINVTTTDDEDVGNSACSLREAIIAAKTDAYYKGCSAGSGADIITLPAGTYTLSSQLPDLEGEITINGASATSTIIEANACNPYSTTCTHDIRIFYITELGKVTLNDLSLRHGKQSISSGGAIANFGNLTINDCLIYNNKGDYGGAIYNDWDGILAMNNSKISHNIASSDGAGIYNRGGLTINNSGIFFSIAGDLGGAIWNVGDLSINNNSNLSNNYAADGAGIYNEGTLTIDKGSIHENRADDGASGGDGGCIFNMSTATISNSSISYNNAKGNGGCIWNKGTLTIEHSTFFHNDADDRGGGVFNALALTINNSTFYLNSAANGGGVYNNELVMTESRGVEIGWSIITNSTFSSNLASSGGGGISNDGIAEITNCTFSRNEGTPGAGITNNYSLEFINTIIANSITGSDCFNSSAGSIVANISNLVEDGSCSAAYSGDPSLGTLADNGGSILTHALLQGSTAIDAGNLAECPGTDQRGITRPKGSGCDIGAFEFFPAEADLTGTPTCGVAPLEVKFSNNSTGEYDTCLWDFGDTTTSNACNALPHTYTEIGLYTVSLTVSGLGGSDMTTRIDYIYVVDESFLPLIKR